MISLAEFKDGTYNWRGLSTDTKPTPTSEATTEGGKVIKPNLNGSTYFEIDTGKLFMFDGDSETWKEL